MAGRLRLVIACVALVNWVVLLPPVAAGQQDPVPPVRIQVSVYMLATQIRSLAGQQVELLAARVSRIVSPRMFLLEHDGPHIGAHRHRVAVLLERGQALAPRGAAVVVSGVARTPLGAWLTPAVPPLTGRELDAVRGPAVFASQVETPGGVNLVHLTAATEP